MRRFGTRVARLLNRFLDGFFYLPPFPVVEDTFHPVSPGGEFQARAGGRNALLLPALAVPEAGAGKSQDRFRLREDRNGDPRSRPTAFREPGGKPALEPEAGDDEIRGDRAARDGGKQGSDHVRARGGKRSHIREQPQRRLGTLRADHSLFPGSALRRGLSTPRQPARREGDQGRSRPFRSDALSDFGRFFGADSVPSGWRPGERDGRSAFGGRRGMDSALWPAGVHFACRRDARPSHGGAAGAGRHPDLRNRALACGGQRTDPAARRQPRVAHG